MLFRRFRPPLVLSFLGLLGLLGIVAIGVIAGASITANRGAPIALGAGYTVATACDENVTVKAFTSLDVASGQMYVATISLSDISQNANNGCGQKIMEAALNINGQVVYTSFSIPAASTDKTFTFGGATNLVGDYNASTVLNPFPADGLNSIAITQLGSWNKRFISYGQEMGCAVLSSGGLKCWGVNNGGQVGDGTTTNRSTPVDVSGLSSGVTGISVGIASYSSCALLSTGGVKCWGGNGSGQIGDGTTTIRSTPVDVSGLSSGVSAISVGDRIACAVLSTGAAKCWGGNGSGQIGDGTTTNRYTPVAVSGLSSGVSTIAAGGSHTCALLTTGGVKCWGQNSNGRLGDGTTTWSNFPVDVSGLSSGVSAISAGGQHTCALLSTGGVKCWGFNSSGQLGDGTITNSSTPVNVSGLSSGVTAISTGWSSSCALLSTGAVKCWGGNGSGQLGDGTKTNSSTPVDVLTLSSGVSAISAGYGNTCALLGGGVVKCWGANYTGQLGDGTTTERLTPTAVVGLP
jgi:alpha-tubulin suppressor-like RCC1 family protein